MMTRSQSKRLAEEMAAASKYKIDTPAAEQIIAQAQEKQEAWERRQKIQNRRKTPKRLSQSPDKKERSASRGKKKVNEKANSRQNSKAKKGKKNYILKRIETADSPKTNYILKRLE